MVLAAAFAAAVSYAAAPGLGFALDDDPVLRLNPVVTEGRVADAAAGPYWRLEPGLGLLWRPVTMASFAAEWALWDGRPAAFHAVNVVVHAGVTALVTALLLALAPAAPGLLGGLLFAVHPVHVEAVANVVGRSELYAAAAFLAACLLLLARARSPAGRAGRVLGIGAAYAVALGSKEIAVTLPAVLALLAVHPGARRGGAPEEGGGGRLLPDAPVFLLLAGVLAAYLVLRLDVLGSLTGELLPAELVGTTTLQRVWTALSLWPHYLRLMVFPLDLVADYGPGVLAAQRSFGPAAAGGLLVLVGVVGLAAATWRRAPLVSLGLAWFLVTVLPVAHLGVHAGVLLAERTLYLPSVGVALVATGCAVAWRARAPGSGAWWASRRVALPATAVVLALLAARTVTRVPVWDSPFTLFRDLAERHPESHRALRLYGDLLVRSGDAGGAADAFARAAAVHPHRYPVLLEAGAAHREAGDLAGAREYFERAVRADPRRRQGWGLLAAAHLEAGAGREAHRAAVSGLARAGRDPRLWSALSEAYLLRGDLDAALRARRAALGADPGSVADLRRLAEILDMDGDSVAAARARARADSVERTSASGAHPGEAPPVPSVPGAPGGYGGGALP